MIHRRLCKHIVECESARGACFLTRPPARSCIACRAATPAPRGCPGGALNPLGWGLPGSTLAGGPRVGAFVGRCWPAAPVGGAVAGWSWPGTPLGEASANQCWPATPIGVPFCLQCWPATPRGVSFCFQGWPATPRGNLFFSLKTLEI